MGTSSLHGVLASVLLDYSLMLPGSHILHKGISSLHVLPPCAFVSPNAQCLMTTGVTGIFHILVQIVVMNLKHTLSSSLILTLVTGKHVSFITAGD